MVAIASVLCDHPYAYQYVDSVEEDRDLVWHRPRNYPLRKQVTDLVGPGTLVSLVAVSVLRGRLNAFEMKQALLLW